jgi:hypothetical protein
MKVAPQFIAGSGSKRCARPGTASAFFSISRHFVPGYCQVVPDRTGMSFSVISQSAAADTGLLSLDPFGRCRYSIPAPGYFRCVPAGSISTRYARPAIRYALASDRSQALTPESNERIVIAVFRPWTGRYRAEIDEFPVAHIQTG